jgi:hypothetical protein
LRRSETGRSFRCFQQAWRTQQMADLNLGNLLGTIPRLANWLGVPMPRSAQSRLRKCPRAGPSPLAPRLGPFLLHLDDEVHASASFCRVSARYRPSIPALILPLIKREQRLGRSRVPREKDIGAVLAGFGTSPESWQCPCRPILIPYSPYFGSPDRISVLKAKFR